MKFPPGIPIELILDSIKLLNRVNYDTEVMLYLEYLGYPDYIVEFNAEDLAHRIAVTQKECFNYGLSHKMCALCIFGHTWAHGIKPLLEADMKGTKH